MAAPMHSPEGGADLDAAELGEGQGQGQPAVHPVVQGVPVEPAPERVGVAVVDGIPTHVEALEPLEIVVLNYSMAISCFASMDIITTVLNSLSLVNGLWWGLLGLVLLLGPLCGLIGAHRLNRCLVGVYLAFCATKVAYEIAIAVIIGMLSTWAFLWPALIAVLQFWITKIVATFWSGLGHISPQRRRELAATKEVPARMVYW